MKMKGPMIPCLLGVSTGKKNTLEVFHSVNDVPGKSVGSLFDVDLLR